METNPRVLRVALAQLNPTVGDLEGNGRKVVEWTERAREAGADLVAFPELFLTGYPPEDLLLKPSFIRDNLRQLEKVAAAARGIALVVGFVDMENDIYNAAAFAFDGEVKGVYHKYYLPNYGVFDEERYFRRGARSPLFVYQGVRIGVSICEDAWYPSGPLSVQALHGAELLVNINGSPYHAGKREARETMIRTRAMDARAFMAWVNTSGGQDELVFDGNSVVYGPEGQVIAHAPSFEETLLVGDLDAGSVFSERLHDTRLRREAQEPVHVDMAVTEVEVGDRKHAPRKWLRAPIAEPLEGPAEVYAAVVTGTRDYVHKNGFAKVVLGLSGGVDSALTAAIAADALGPQNVIGVTDALALHLGREPGGRGGVRRGARHPAAGDPHRPRPQSFRGDVQGLVRRHQAGRRGGEHPAPDPGHHPDGALQQVRLPAPLDRQQVGAGDRLLHALRRHGGRLRGAEGHPQDARLRALPVPQLGQRESDTGADPHQGAVRRAAREPEGQRQPAPVRGARPDPSRLRRGRPQLRRAGRRRPRPGNRHPRHPARRPQRVQAPAGSARGEDHAPRLRTRPADAAHQSLRCRRTGAGPGRRPQSRR